MSDSDWLSLRTPSPPPELAQAIRDALKARNISSAAPTPTDLLETARSLLEKVLETDCAQRDSAFDLLTADALVTYALEIANDDAKALREFSQQTMRAVAGLGAHGDTTSSATPRGSK